MKKILIPITTVALVLLVGAGCYSKKSTVNTSTTNASDLNTNTVTNATNTNTSAANENANDNTNATTSNINGNANTNVNAAPTTPSSATISMAGSSFSPASVTVTKGGSVTFNNNDSVGHTVNIGGTDHSVSSGSSYTLSTSGLAVEANSYSCSIHPSMTGTINVVQG